MTYKSKNAQVMLKDLCMKPGEFFQKKNKSEACSSFNVDLTKVHVTIKIFQYESFCVPTSKSLNGTPLSTLGSRGSPRTRSPIIFF